MEQHPVAECGDDYLGMATVGGGLDCGHSTGNVAPKSGSVLPVSACSWWCMLVNEVFG